MVGLTREQFERALFRPPHAARMTEHAGRFTERLDKDDKEALLTMALDRLWETRTKINSSKDVLLAWISALEYAASRRPVWRIWFNVYEHRLVKGTWLGRER